MDCNWVPLKEDVQQQWCFSSQGQLKACRMIIPVTQECNMPCQHRCREWRARKMVLCFLNLNRPIIFALFVDSFQLENTFNIFKSNSQPNTTMVIRLCQKCHVYMFFLAPSGTVTPSPYWLTYYNTCPLFQLGTKDLLYQICFPWWNFRLLPLVLWLDIRPAESFSMLPN